MDRFADTCRPSQRGGDSRAVVASGAIRSSETRDALTATIRSMLDAGARAGHPDHLRRPDVANNPNGYAETGYVESIPADRPPENGPLT
jgi:hypothetical protein